MLDMGRIESENGPSDQRAEGIPCQMPNQLERAGGSQGKGKEKAEVLKMDECWQICAEEL